MCHIEGIWLPNNWEVRNVWIARSSQALKVITLKVWEVLPVQQPCKRQRVLLSLEVEHRPPCNREVNLIGLETIETEFTVTGARRCSAKVRAITWSLVDQSALIKTPDSTKSRHLFLHMVNLSSLQLPTIRTSSKCIQDWLTRGHSLLKWLYIQRHLKEEMARLEPSFMATNRNSIVRVHKFYFHKSVELSDISVPAVLELLLHKASSR